MQIDLEKVDIIRERAGLSYRDAVEYLNRAEGDVVKALVFIEEDRRLEQAKIADMGQEVLDKIKGVIRRGNETKIRVERYGKTMVELPVTAGIIGTAIAPQLALVGAVTALATGCSISIETAGQFGDDQQEHVE
ncbi:MAG: DUF4342 domain-containing protein [Firmicutes bacterium]|jgi:NACalpha-BTF3-like transcription factor|nr:DUF4342 domain-containing protein [Bacillota bacterium]